jgi:hypothetical protein
MSKVVRAAALAAAILVAGCATAPLQPTSTPRGTGAPATATPLPAVPTAAASPRPAAAASPQIPASADPAPVGDSLTLADIGTTLTAGTYMPGEFGMGMLITLPDGFDLETLDVGNVAFSWPHGYLGAFIPEAVFPDPCHVAGSPVPITSGDDLLAALTSMKGFVAGPVTETTVSGRRTRMFELSNTIDTSNAGCTRDAMLPLFAYKGHAEDAATNGNTHQVLWVIDGQVGSGLLRNVYAGPILVVADNFTSGADLDILKAVAMSIQL